MENSIELNEQDQIKCPFCDSDKENKEINDYDETTSTGLDNNQNNNNCNKKWILVSSGTVWIYLNNLIKLIFFLMKYLGKFLYYGDCETHRFHVKQLMW